MTRWEGPTMSNGSKGGGCVVIWREGDYFRHIAYPDLVGCVVRVEDWGGGSPVLVGRDATGEFPPGQTFKVPADQVRKVTP